MTPPSLSLADAAMMASAPAPPTLLISDPQNSGTESPPLLSATGATSIAPISTPAFRCFISRISSLVVGSSSFYLVDGFEIVLIETLGALVLLTVLVLTILVVLLTSVASLLISALMVGAAIVVVHGTFRVSEDLFLDIQELAMACRSEYGPSQPLKGVHISGSLHMTIQTMIADLTDLPNAPRLLSSLAPSIFPANSASCHPAAADYSPFCNAGRHAW